MQKILLFVCLSSIFFAQTQRVVALRVAFQEDESEFTTGNGLFDLRSDMPSDSVLNIVIDPPPHNKSYFEDHLLFAKNYFSNTLNVNLEYEVYPNEENASFQLSEKMFHYNPNTEEDSLKGIIKLYTEAYDLAVNAGINLQASDIVIVFHAGVGNDIFKEINNTPHDIPSLSLSKKLLDRYAPTWNNGSKSLRGIILPETASQEGLQLAINGLVVANIGTQLGLLDLVDPVNKSTVVGPWALEDRGLFNAAGLLPSIPSAFNRLHFSGELDTLKALELSSSEKAVELTYQNSSLLALPKVQKIALNTNEYLLVEYRKREVYNSDARLNIDELVTKFTPINQIFLTYKEVLKHPDFSHADDFTFSERGVLINAANFDAAIPHSGIAVWHVDNSVVQKYKAANEINRDSRLRGVRFLEADGVDNYSTGGDGFNDERFDVFYNGNEAKYYNNRLDDNTFPSAKSNYEAAHSGLILNNFSSLGESMTFTASLKSEFTKIHFPRKLSHIHFRKDSSFAAALSADSIWLYKKADADLTFSIKRIENSLAIDGNILAQINNFLYIEASSEIKVVNVLTGQNTKNYAISSDIVQAEIIGNKLYLLDASKTLSLIENNVISELQENVDTLFRIEDKLFFVHINESMYQIIDTSFEYIAYTKDALIKVGTDFFPVELSQNKLFAYDINNTRISNFPKEIDYRYERGTIKQLWQFANYLVTLDSENILKVTALNKVNNNNLTIYGGFQPSFVHLNISDEIITFADSNNFYQQKIKLPAQKAQSNLPSGLEVVDKKHSYLWPNPNSASEGMYLRLQTAKIHVATIRIFTEIGQLRKSFKAETKAVNPTDIRLPVNELASGTYFIQVEVAGQTLLRKATVIH